MTTICIARANAGHTAGRRDDSVSIASTPRLSLRRRLATHVYNAVRHRQPMTTASEQVLAGIRNVHSLTR